MFPLALSGTLGRVALEQTQLPEAWQRSSTGALPANPENQDGTMTLKLRFADAPLGHEILDVDLSKELDDATFEDIQKAFDEYGVVLFRGQTLTPQQQLDFSRRFGSLEKFLIDTFLLPGFPEIFVVSNILENGRPIGMADAGRNWHSDMAFVERPPRGSALYALEVPHDANEVPLGDTLFASTSAAYDALPVELKRRIDGLKVLNSYRIFTERKARQEMNDGGKKTQAEREKNKDSVPDVVHPLVRTHPRTGRKCLYVSGPLSVGIVGMAEGEADALLDMLREHMTQPRFIYRHSWKAGDLVLWDNCSAIHNAIGDYQLPQRRRMHRTTIEGTAPF